MNSLTRQRHRKRLRQRTNNKYRNCNFFSVHAGTWKQQATLCSCVDCSRFELRLFSFWPTPNRVLRYYRMGSDDLIAARSNDPIVRKLKRLGSQPLTMRNTPVGHGVKEQPGRAEGIFRATPLPNGQWMVDSASLGTTPSSGMV